MLRETAEVGICWFGCGFEVCLQRIAVFFEGIKRAYVFKYSLVLHHHIKDYQTIGTWCKIHASFVILVLTEKKLSLL